jgi:hypothetical protein
VWNCAEKPGIKPADSCSSDSSFWSTDVSSSMCWRDPLPRAESSFPFWVGIIKLMIQALFFIPRLWSANPKSAVSSSPLAPSNYFSGVNDSTLSWPPYLPLDAVVLDRQGLRILLLLSLVPWASAGSQGPWWSMAWLVVGDLGRPGVGLVSQLFAVASGLYSTLRICHNSKFLNIQSFSNLL